MLTGSKLYRQQLQTELVNVQRERDEARRNAHHWTVRYNDDTARLQAARQRLQTNAQNQVNRMIANIARKQARIGVLLREKFVFQLVIRQRDQNILILQQQILALQNIPPGNMAAVQDALQIMAPPLAHIPQYIGQETPDDYFNKVMQVFTYSNQVGFVGFNYTMKTTLLASKMVRKFTHQIH